ncbi:MAG: potassium-transporting ATPase subunit KdpA, partial [Vulcanimicrobiaceae bacterium]
MTAIGWLQTLAFFVVILALTKPLGLYLTRVFEGDRTWFSPVLEPVERLIYRLCGVRADEEMSWITYALAMLAFSAVGLAYL